MSHWQVGSRPASKGAAAAALFQRAEGCNPSPLQLSQSDPWGSGREHRWPRAMGPTLGKLQAESVSCGQGSPCVLSGQLPAQRRAALLLEGAQRSLQGFGHCNPTNAANKPRLPPPALNALPTPHALLLAFSLLVLRMCLSSGVLAECWIIIKC